MGKLFGTDGVRGVANTELSADLAYRLGRAGAYVLTRHKKHTPKLIIAADTRRSAFMLQSALAAGICSVGGDCTLAGVLPTPAVAYLARGDGFDAGVVLSASHNAFADNGIKFFDNSGFKLADAIESEIETLVTEDFASIPSPVGEGVGIGKDADLSGAYADFLVRAMGDVTLEGLKIAVDCANGATYKTAPAVLSRLGAQLFVINAAPNGVNINAHCGSTHMAGLCECVLENKADIGVAFDGDGDRCLLVDENGKIVAGDEIMAMLACEMKARGELKNNTLVATVMSNLGLTKMCEREGITLEQTAVGDRYVLERMLAGGFNIGGENSGHIIFLDHNTTGDGILTALMVLKLMKTSGVPLSKLNTKMTVMPQVLINANVASSNKYTYLENEKVKAAVEELSARYLNTGRVLIRPSGTESYVRVMLEGQDLAQLEKDAKALAAVIEKELL